MQYMCIERRTPYLAYSQKHIIKKHECTVFTSENTTKVSEQHMNQYTHPNTTAVLHKPINMQTGVGVVRSK